MMRRSSLLMAVLLAGAGCGDNGSSGVCEDLCNKLCRMATDCIKTTGQDDCYFQVTSATGGTSTQGRNPAGRGCEVGMTKDVCGDATKTASLFSACAAALGEAKCAVVDSKDTLVLPGACQGLLDCKSGPCLN